MEKIVIERWKACDGSLFDSEKDAKDYEDSLGMKDELTEWIEFNFETLRDDYDSLRGDGWYSFVTDVVDKIYRNQESLRSIMNAHHVE